MNAIWSFLESSPVLVIVLILVVAYIFSRLGSHRTGEVAKEDLVPHYRRFDRRNIEFGDRRQQEGNKAPEGVERNAGRRADD